MVAIVSGNSLGLLNGSAGVLGQQGVFGNAVHGNGKEATYVNVFNGNLSLQDSDDFLASRGVNVALTRTYNSLGSFNDGHGGWKVGPSKQVTNLTGERNNSGSTVTRIDSDGSAALYTYNAALGLYRSTDGGGGYDNLRMNSASEWIWTSERRDMQGLYEVYDSTKNAGHITSSHDQNGLQADQSSLLASYTYEAGQLSLVTDAAGDRVYYSYTDGNLSQIRTVPADTGQQSSKILYTYDSNRLTTVTIDLTPGDNADAKTYTTTYTYRGTSNQIASVTQADGTTLTFGYTQLPATTGPWLLTMVTDGLGQKTTYDYSVPGSTTVADPMGYKTVYKYDLKGQLTDVIAPVVAGVNQKTSFVYDTDGNILSTTDPRGLTTVYQYDGNGNRVYERNAAGNTVTRSYDPVSNKLLTETVYLLDDPDGAGPQLPSQPLTTNYVYDSKNRLHFVISPEGRVQEYRYDTQGQRKAALQYTVLSTVPLGTNANAQSSATDAAMTAWATSSAVAASLVNRTDYNFDAHGLVSKSSSYASLGGTDWSSEAVSTKIYAYDARGLLLKTVDGNGNATNFTYDGLGRLLSSKDAAGNISTVSYDATNNIVKTTQANGLIVNTAYDKNGHVISVAKTNTSTLALGTTTYVYNSDGKVYKSTDAAGLISYVIYDTAGRKVADIDPAGALTEYRYNLDNQVTRTVLYSTVVAASTLAAITGTTALSAVRPSANANDRGTWTVYDVAGRLSETVDALGNVTHYDYDGASRLVQAIQRATALTPAQMTALATVDIPGAFGASPSAADRFSRTLYDNDGKIQGKLDPDGGLTEYKYDGVGQLTKTSAYATATASAARAAGDLNALRPLAAAADIHHRYFYNAQGQAVAAIDGANYLTETSYDSAGNVATVTRYVNVVSNPGGATLAAIGKTANAADQRTSYTYSALNQRVTETGPDGVVTRYTYDNAGNVTEARRAPATADERITLMRYDLLGNVIAQLTPTGAALLAGAATQTAIDAVWTANAVQYTYNGDGLRTGMKDQNGNRTLYYYDNDSKLVYTIDPRGALVTRVYNAFDQVTSLRQSTTLIPAATLAGLTSAMTSAPLTSGTITPSVSSAVAAAQTASDSIEALVYDNAGHRTDGINPLGGHTLTSYDAFGNAVQITQTDAALAPLGTTTNVYDAAGRLLRSTQNGATTYYVYDAFGRVTGQVAPNGELTEYVYDADNRLIRTTAYATPVSDPSKPLDVMRPAPAANDRSTWNRYDAASNRTDTVDAGAYLTHYDFDAAGRMVKATRYATALANPASFAAPTPGADDRVLRTLYNADGDVVAKLDADGYLTRNIYNADGHLIETIAYANAAPAAARAAGDLTALTPATDAGDIHQHFLYNAAGQLIAAVDGENYLTEVSYDVVGNVTMRTRRALAVITPGAATVGALGMTANANDQVTSYTYSALHQVLIQTDPDGTITRYTYDKMGNVTETRRALGAADERAGQAQYDALGRLTAELTPQGVAAIAAGSALATAWATYAVKYTYNGAGQRASMADQDGHRTLYYYDANGNLSYQINAAGEVTTTAYSIFNRPTQVTQINGRIAAATLASLTGTETLASIQSTVAAIGSAGPNSVTTTSYDVLGRAVDRTDALGFHTLSTYDAFGDLVSTLDQVSGMRNSYQYDRRGNLIQSTPFSNAAGNPSSSASYDAFGRRIGGTDANGVSSALRYDHLGHVVAIQDPSNPAAAMSYDAFGRVLTQTDDLDNITTYAYNTAGLSFTVTTPENVTHITTQNHFGQTVSIKDGTTAGGVNTVKNTTTYVYDKNGNLTSVSDTAGTIQSHTYDNANLQLTSVDANGATTAITYDAANRVLTRIVDSTGLKLKTSYTYDALGRQSSVTDPNGNVTVINYDADGQVTSIVADSGAGHLNLTTRFSYDSQGRKLSVTDPNGVITTYTYASNGHALSSVQDIGGLNLPSQVIYDGSGKNLLLRATAQEVTRYAYDNAGNLIWQVDAMGAVTGYTYDADNRLVKTIHYAKLSSLFTGQPPAANQTFTTAQIAASVTADAAEDATSRIFYDKDGRVAATVDALGDTTVYLGYNAQNKSTETINYAKQVAVTDSTTTAALLSALAALATPASDGHQILIYDARGRVTAILTAVGLNSSSVQQWALESISYDPNGNVTNRTNFDNLFPANVPTAANITSWIATQPAAGDKSVSLFYDKANRLTASATLLRSDSTTAMNLWSIATLAYDANSNVVLRRSLANGMPLSQGVVPTASAITSFSTTAANLAVADVQTSMVYDAANRLVATATAQTSATSTATTSTWTVATQAYDADGNVAQRRVYATQLPQGGITKTPAASDIATFIANPSNSTLADQQSYFGYDHANRLTATASAGSVVNGVVQWIVTSRQYDSFGNLTQSIQYSNAVDASSLGANASAAAMAAKVAGGAFDDRITRYNYDLGNRVTDTVDAGGYLTHYDYDSASHVTKSTRYATVTQPGTFSTTSSADDRSIRAWYDQAGHAVAQLDADGYLSCNTYNANGQLIESVAYASATPAAARTSGSLSDLLPLANANDIHQHFLYNPAGQVIASVDGENYLTELSYDALGNALKRTRHAKAVTTPGATSVAGMGLTADATNDQVTSYTYSSQGQVLTQTDPDGTVTRNTYNALGSLTETRRAFGAADERATQMRYDAQGRVIAQLTPQGVAYLGATTDQTAINTGWANYSVKYSYNGSGQRASMTDQDSHRTLYYYDVSGNMSYSIDAAGEVTAYTYSVFNQQTSATRINGRLAPATLASLSGNEALASIQSTVAAITPVGANNTVRAVYDNLGRVMDRADALGFHTQSTYDAFGDLLRTQNVTSGIATAYQYDRRGNLIQTTPYANVVGNPSSTVSYDAFGRGTGRTDANGVASSVAYDHLGRAITIQDPSNPIAQLSYDAFGRVLTQTDDLNNVTTYRYNTAGLSYTITTPEGVTHTTTLNHFGQTVTIADAIGGVTENSTTYTYDKNGNLTSVLDNVGRMQTNTYDAANLQLTSVDANSVTTKFTYDAVNRVLSKSVDPTGLNLTSSYTYDALGRQATMADPNGNVTVTNYDADGQVRSIVVDSGAGHLNLTTRFSYDSLGRKLSVTDPNGIVTSFSYDANGNASSSVEDVGGVNLPTRNIYDSTGNHLLLRSTSGQVTRYAYDVAGNLVWQIDPTGAVTGYTYDADNRLVKTTQYSKQSSLFTGAQPPTAEQTFTAAQIAVSVTADAAHDATSRTFYDKDGRIYARFDAAGNNTVYLGYNAQGKATEVISYASTVAASDTTTTASLIAAFAGKASPNDRHQFFNYDARGRTIGIATAVGQNASKIMQWQVAVLKYDANGNLISRSDRSVLQTSNAPTAANIDSWTLVAPATTDDQTCMVYDKANRLVATCKLANAVVTVDNSDPDNSYTYTTNYWSVSTQAYDSNGNVVQRNSYANVMVVASTTLPTAASIASYYVSLSNQNAADAQTNLVYDSANRLTATATAQGGIGATRTWSVTTQRYDKDGYLLSTRSAATALTGATLTATQITGVATAASDAITNYQYDHLGHVVASAVAQSQDAQGNTQWAISTNDLSPTGLVLRSVRYATLITGTLPADLTTLKGSLACAGDQVTRYAYDQDSRAVLSVNGENEVTQLVYDTRGNVVETIQYGALDNVPATLDGWQPVAGAAAPRVTRAVYDLDSRLILGIDAQGGVSETRYDTLGNRSASVRYAIALTSAQLTALGAAPTSEQVRAVLAVDALNDRTTRYVYDDEGQLRFTVDAAGYITENRYNGFGQMVTQYAYKTAKQFADVGLADALVTEATKQAGNCRTLSYTYDLNGNLLTATDAAGGIKKYSYDACGRQSTYTDELNSVWTYLNDATGRRISESSPKVAAYTSSALTTTMGAWGTGTQTSLITKYVYNALGQLSSKTEASGTEMERAITYGYDLAGRLVSTTQPAVKVYDAVNDPLSSGGSTVAIEKDTGPRTIVITYDAFGDAVATTDIGGVTSYAVFDKLGRKTADIDAQGYVTTYGLNAFGERAKLTRYATSIGAVSAPLSGTALAQRLVKDGANDRTLTTDYDGMGRVILVREPVVEVYDPHSQGQSVLIHAGKTTATRYNAFGEVIETSVYGADLQGKQVTDTAVTRTYYDTAGNVAAQIDALSAKAGAQQGYLTTFARDLAGNVATKTEYGSAMTSWSDDWPSTLNGFLSAAPDTKLDRVTGYTYDGCNRVVTETNVGVIYADSATSLDSINKLNVTTTYAYDKRGLRTTVSNALGNTTYTYYDKLGRVTGTASYQQSTVSGVNSGAGASLTEYKRDICGNAILTIAYAQGVNGAPTVGSATAFAATDINNRVTAKAFNIDGNAIQVIDAEQFAKAPASRSPAYTSYDAYGRAVKQWRSVTNGTATQTSYQVSRYDALGRVTDVVTPNDRAAGNVVLQDHVAYQYNSFGELTQTSAGDYYRYDQAGNVWLSNATGADQVSLHDVMGQTTVAIKSTSATDPHALQALNTASDALLLDDVQRTDTRYDMLGHAIDNSDSNSNHAELLQQVNGNWIKTSSAINKATAGSLLILGRPENTDKTFTVRYRSLSSNTWIDAPSASIQWVNGYPTFSTAGLAGGDYAYQVFALPGGATVYQAGGGTLSISTRDAVLAQSKQFIALYLMLFNRAPTQAEVNTAMQSLDRGKTLPQLAGSLLGSDEGKSVLTGSNAVAGIYAGALGKSLGDPAVAADAQAWSAQLDLSNRSGWHNGEVLVNLLNANSAVLDRRATALLNYLVVQGGSNTASAAQVLLHANTAADGAISEGSTAALAERQRDQITSLYLSLTGAMASQQDSDSWFSALQTGRTLQDVAQGLLDLLKPGNNVPLSQSDVITRLFTYLLGRAPSTAEMTGRQAQMNGTPQLSAAAFAVAFMQEVSGYLGADATMTQARAELFDKVKLAQAYMGTQTAIPGADTISVGNAYIDGVVAAATAKASGGATALQLYQNLVKAQRAISTMGNVGSISLADRARMDVARLYVTILGRPPELAELRSGLALLNDANDKLALLATNLLQSQSAAPGALYPSSMSDSAFVAQLYQSLNGQTATDSVLASWTSVATTSGRAAVLTQMLAALRADQSTGTAAARALLENKATVAISYAEWISYSDRQVGAATLAKVSGSDITSAITYATAQRQAYDTQTQNLRDLAPQLSELSSGYQALKNVTVQSMPAFAQAALLYTCVLNRGNMQTTSAEIVSLAATIRSSGLSAGVQALLNTTEGKNLYGAELTDGVGQALALHYYAILTGQNTMPPDALSYWTGRFKADVKQAMVEMLNPSILTTPATTASNGVSINTTISLRYAYAGFALSFSLAAQTGALATEKAQSQDALNVLWTAIQGVDFPEMYAMNAIAAQPDTLQTLAVVQALLALPGTNINIDTVNAAKAAINGGATLESTVAALAMNNPQFNPGNLAPAAALAAIPRSFAAAMYAALRPADTSGNYDQSQIDALWAQLKTSGNIGATIIALSNPSYGASTPTPAVPAVVSTAFVSLRLAAKLKELWPDLATQTAAQMALDAQQAIAISPLEFERTRVAYLYVTILGRPPEMAELNNGVTLLNDPAGGTTALSKQLLQGQGSRYPGSMSDGAFAAALYQSLYGQSADAPTLAAWTAKTGVAGRAGALAQMLTAMLADQNPATASVQSLLKNKAAVAVIYAKSISYGDAQVGSDMLSQVTSGDSAIATSYGTGKRQAYDAVNQTTRDLANQQATMAGDYANVQNQNLLSLPPLSQAALLYSSILSALPTVANMQALAKVIQQNGTYAAAQQLLNSVEGQSIYGADLSNPAALAKHLYTKLTGQATPPAPGTLDYWTDYLKTNLSHAVVAMIGPILMATPTPGIDAAARYRVNLAITMRYIGAYFSLNDLAQAGVQAARDALESQFDVLQAAYLDTGNLNTAKAQQPAAIEKLNVLQAILVLPGVTVTDATLNNALNMLHAGTPLDSIVAQLILNSAQFNPAGLGLAAATANVSRGFAAALYAKLYPANPDGSYDTVGIEALWTQLKTSTDIGKTLLALANPAGGGNDPLQAAASIASAKTVASQLQAMVNALWPDMATQTANQQAADTAQLRNNDKVSLFYALQVALGDKASAVDGLIDGSLSLDNDLNGTALSMLSGDGPRARALRPMGNSEFVQAIYTAFGWPASQAEKDSNAAKLADGNTRFSVAIDIANSIVHYIGNDPAQLARHLLVQGQLVGTAASDQLALNSYASTTAAALGQANVIATQSLNSADIHLISADSTSLHTSVLGSVMPKMTVDRWGNVLTVADVRDPNYKTTYTYNFRNEQTDQVFQVSDTDSTTNITTTSTVHVQHRYDALGRMEASVDGNGNVTTFGYDSFGNVAAEQHPDGGTVTDSYDLFGQRTATSLNAVKRNYAYDHLGHLARTWTDAAVNVYSISNPDPQVGTLAITSTSRQLSDSYSYDELGRRISNTDGSGAVTRQQYDLNGDVVATTDGLGYVSTNTYDNQHHRIKQIDANGNAQSWVYDDDGRLVESTDMAGTKTHYSYNAVGQLVQKTSTQGQDIRYTYSGNLSTRIEDVATGLTTDYTYDAAGNRLTEKQSYASWVNLRPEHVQNNSLSYDMQNRLVSVQDDQYKLTYHYDNNGNRKQVTTVFTDANGLKQTLEAYNTYDSMNRQLIVNGDKVNGVTVYGAHGHKITYDKAGNRLTDTYIGTNISVSGSTYSTVEGQATTETYAYDGAGRLSTVKRDVLVVDTRHYDGAGRTMESGFVGTAANTSLVTAAAAIGLSADAKLIAYDADGRVLRQQTKVLGGIVSNDIRYTSVDNGGHTIGGYDKVGNVLGYQVTTTLGQARTDQYKFDYDVRATYAEKNVHLNNTSSTVSVYDVNGQRIRLDKVDTASGQTSSTTSYWYDADGHIMSRKEDANSIFSMVVNGNVLGNETRTIDNYLGQNWVSAISSVYGAGPSVYTVQGGETIRAIAQRIWGDSNLWYMIADLNGLKADATLTAGQVLKIPARINTIHNDYQTWQPYNAGAAMGDTMPIAAPGDANGCGVMGNLVTTSIAIAATYVTSGALNKQALDYLSRELGGADAANKAMQTARIVSEDVVGKLLNLNKSQFTSIAADFLTAVMHNDGSAAAVTKAFTSYGSGLSQNASTARALLVQAANAGAGFRTELQTAFDWKAIARAEAAKAAAEAAERARERAAAAEQEKQAKAAYEAARTQVNVTIEAATVAAEAARIATANLAEVQNRVKTTSDAADLSAQVLIDAQNAAEVASNKAKQALTNAADVISAFSKAYHVTLTGQTSAVLVQGAAKQESRQLAEISYSGSSASSDSSSSSSSDSGSSDGGGNVVVVVGHPDGDGDGGGNVVVVVGHPDRVDNSGSNDGLSSSAAGYYNYRGGLVFGDRSSNSYGTGKDTFSNGFHNGFTFKKTLSNDYFNKFEPTLDDFSFSFGDSLGDSFSFSFNDSYAWNNFGDNVDGDPFDFDSKNLGEAKNIVVPLEEAATQASKEAANAGATLYSANEKSDADQKLVIQASADQDRATETKQSANETVVTTLQATGVAAAALVTADADVKAAAANVAAVAAIPVTSATLDGSAAETLQSQVQTMLTASIAPVTPAPVPTIDATDASGAAVDLSKYNAAGTLIGQSYPMTGTTVDADGKPVQYYTTYNPDNALSWDINGTDGTFLGATSIMPIGQNLAPTIENAVHLGLMEPPASTDPSLMSYGDQMGKVGQFFGDLASGAAKGLDNLVPETAAFVYRMTGYAAAGVVSLFDTDTSDKMFSQYEKVTGRVVNYDNGVQAFGGATAQIAAPWLFKGASAAGVILFDFESTSANIAGTNSGTSVLRTGAYSSIEAEFTSGSGQYSQKFGASAYDAQLDSSINGANNTGGPIFNPAGAARAEKFSDFQQKVSASETIANIAGENPIITYTESGKTLYTNPSTGLQVVYDNAGKYFRIEDTNMTGPLRYTDQFGQPIPNNVSLIKSTGTSQTGVPGDVRKALTHFTDSD
ncbi:LysM peptidoglycan-binding domain-containing protein [Oxalobacteraceae bacterium]|nr:LysM peptidoglycan-binding domain-containing protein [Oxalobacteraceae bacterium]